MEQEQALQILKSGRNVFLTGSAGTGKTYVLNTYIHFLRERGVGVAVTASTGIAATHMQGTTIHSWSGIGIKDSIGIIDLEHLAKRRYMKTRMKKVQVLIIDEISMLHKKQLEMVDFILQYFKENNLPFGGVQVVLSGDFFQLPPVTRNEETTKQKFSFMAHSWVDANLHICYLNKQYRQEENELADVLNEIRSGKISSLTESALQEAQYNKLSEVPIKLYTHNMDVDEINRRELQQIGDYVEAFVAKTKGNNLIVAQFKKSLLCPENLDLKIGARVMFVKNNYEEGYMNGTLGTVTGYDDDTGYPLVETIDNKTIVAEPQMWTVENEMGKSLASFEQVPLRLAWAITVHKSQGMTLEMAEIDLTKTFEKGQGYVALSRLKTMDGMKLLGYNEIALQVDSLALKADKRFQELSLAIEKSLNEEQLKDEELAFMDYLGAKLKKIKKTKISTQELTKELLEKGMSIREISKERELVASTIIGHIDKLKRTYPDINIEHLKPERDMVLLAEHGLREVIGRNNEDDFTEKGEPKLSAVYKELKGEVDYGVLKLCLLFVKKD